MATPPLSHGLLHGQRRLTWRARFQDVRTLVLEFIRTMRFSDLGVVDGSTQDGEPAIDLDDLGFWDDDAGLQMIHTAEIGLPAASVADESGSVEKQPAFSTTWDPRDPATSAGRSRAYAIRASLVWITDLVNVYRRGASKLPGVCTGDELARIQGGRDDGSSIRLERFSRHVRGGRRDRPLGLSDTPEPASPRSGLADL